MPNLDKIKQCVAEIADNIDKIKHIEDHKMLIDSTTTTIEDNLKIIVDEVVKLTNKETYFNVLKSNCEKFSDCKFCPLTNYKEEFTTKCKDDMFDTYTKYSTEEIIEAYNYCKKYWEDLFHD